MVARADQRRSARCAIELFVEETHDGQTYLHPAVDLSVHGIYILMADTRQAIDGYRQLDLEFTLPGGPRINASGKVVHVDDLNGQRGVRVAFEEITDEHRTAVSDYIAANAT